jgi:septal ring factor EnvC (AmiA/AmiB activator)
VLKKILVICFGVFFILSVTMPVLAQNVSDAQNEQLLQQLEKNQQEHEKLTQEMEKKQQEHQDLLTKIKQKNIPVQQHKQLLGQIKAKQL